MTRSYFYLVDTEKDEPVVVYIIPPELRGIEVTYWERRLRAQEGLDDAETTVVLRSGATDPLDPLVLAGLPRGRVK